MTDDVIARVFRVKKTCRFIGRIERLGGIPYIPFEITNEHGRVYSGKLPLTKLPPALKEGIIHIGRFNQIVPFDLINNWVCGVMI